MDNFQALNRRSLQALLLRHRTMELLQANQPIHLPSSRCPSHQPITTVRPVDQAEIRRLLSGEFYVRCLEHCRSNSVLRMGELEPWIDENFVRNLWFQMGEQVSVKMIRDKFSG
jgi:hypothetical protein